MKKSLFAAAASLMFLAGCSPVAVSPTTETLLSNPLYAEQYWSDLTDRMVQLLQSADFVKDASKRAIADRVRLETLAKAQEATKQRGQGMQGAFVSVGEQADGFALLLNNTLYVSPFFATYPGVSLRIYLTTVVDPRDTAFPDDTSIDLGPLKSPYGAQEYTLDPAQDLSQMRTAVIWDAELERIYSFAQLAR